MNEYLKVYLTKESKNILLLLLFKNLLYEDCVKVLQNPLKKLIILNKAPLIQKKILISKCGKGSIAKFLFGAGLVRA